MELWESDLRDELVRKRGANCEICNSRRATEFNHCLIHDSKRFHKILTCEENGQLVCIVCHNSKGHSRKNREEFAYKQIRRGYDIGKWARGLPLRNVEQWLKDL